MLRHVWQQPRPTSFRQDRNVNIVTPRDYKAIDLNRCPEGMSADTVSCSCRAKDLLHWVQACFEASRERRGLCFQPCTLETRNLRSPLSKPRPFAPRKRYNSWRLYCKAQFRQHHGLMQGRKECQSRDSQIVLNRWIQHVRRAAFAPRLSYTSSQNPVLSKIPSGMS